MAGMGEIESSDRRQAAARIAAVVLLPWALPGHAQGLAALSSADATQGLKAALEKGADTAIRLLGAPDGFLGNPKVRIPLPGYLNDAARLLKAIGRRQLIEDLEIAMNRAAESAVPLARKLVTDAVRGMTVVDAKNILTGGDTSVTQFFAAKTREPLSAQFLPVVRKATEKVALGQKYDAVAGKAAGLGLVRKEDATMDHYVTRKALDGLYHVIGEQERGFRSNPMGSGSAVIGKVFGAGEGQDVRVGHARLSQEARPGHACQNGSRRPQQHRSPPWPTTTSTWTTTGCPSPPTVSS